MVLDRSPDPYCTNEMVGNIRWCGGFEQVWYMVTQETFCQNISKSV